MSVLEWQMRYESVLKELNSAQTQAGAWKINCEKLQAFKDWVHGYLDTHGVPHHPPGPHGAEGCRIGDRMDWLMQYLEDFKIDAHNHLLLLGAATAERDALAVIAERYRLALLRITFNDYSQADIRAHVADALLCTVEELEGME